MARRNLADTVKKAEYAAIMGVHPDTVLRWDDLGFGPKSVRKGPQRARHWSRAEVVAFKKAQDAGEER